MNQNRNMESQHAGARHPQSGQMSGDQHNGAFNRPNANAPPPAATAAMQDRAARYEDEKRRIIESCFAKRDPDGVQAESYITHVRVTEDAAHPSSPPPPDSAPGNKKQRVILVAVRRSGKVRVHKARENPNGTFSIGKTWNLDELTAVQSYSSTASASPQEQRERQWASSEGFTVTLGKPYFWAAPTSKEKDFFIASLIKIFRKYTGGKFPLMSGFSPQEVEQLTGGPVPPPNAPASSQPPRPAQQVPLPGVAQNNFPAPSAPATAPGRNQEAVNYGNISGQTSREPAYTRSEYRPGDRDAPKQGPLPAEALRSPARPEFFPNNREDQRAMPPQGVISRQDQAPARNLAPIDSLRPPPLRAVTPQSSQRSLRSNDQFLDSSSTFTNGHSAPYVAPLEITKKGTGMNYTDGAQETSDPNVSMARSGATSGNQRMTEPAQTRPRFYNESLMEERRPSIPRSEASFGGTSAHSADASGFHTPLTQPAMPFGEPRSQSPLHRPLTPETRPPLPTINSEGSLGASTDNLQANQQPPPASPSPVPSTTGTLSPGTQTPRESADQFKDPSKAEGHRPGLGPMIKKKSAKDIASQFRKAAAAAGAFQPRQGGGAARFKALQDRGSDGGPDGITEVVPAPTSRAVATGGSPSSTPDLASPGSEKDLPITPQVVQPQPQPLEVPRGQLERLATDTEIPQTESTKSDKEPAETSDQSSEKAQDEDIGRSRSPQRKRRQQQEADAERYCAPLGIDPRILELRGLDFCELLTEFGWEGRLPEKQRLDTFEAEIRREIGRAQATGWLGHIDQQDAKIQDLSKAFDNAIAECEELDGLLTLYSHELDTLHEDIDYIEAQSQGLQVQTVNQKLLYNELETLLKTLTISSADMQSLRNASINTTDGIQAIERSLVVLFKAMTTVDPDIQHMKTKKIQAAPTDRRGTIFPDTDTGQMRAVRQKKDQYREEALGFIRRFNQHMNSVFQSTDVASPNDHHFDATTPSGASLVRRGVVNVRQELWMYNTMMLFVRDVNSYEWHTLISSYEMNIKHTYQDQFRDNAMTQRQAAHKPTGEESEALFTNLEKEKPEESLATAAARKLTVRRGKVNKASGLRQTLGDRREGKELWEVFDNVLQQQSRVVSEEQNFLVLLFHLNSHFNMDFIDAVSSTAPGSRRLPNLNMRLPYDPDRDMAKIVQQVTDGIFSFWETDLFVLIEWVARTDQLQSVGVLCALEQCLGAFEDTNQEFITRTVRALHERLEILFGKFVEEQVKAIEETKVRVKKRGGVITFMRVFPIFSAALENMMPTDLSRDDVSEVRNLVDEAYSRILRAMWESLNYIAKDNPVSGGGMVSLAYGGGETEEKQAINYHILFIENTNHFVEEVEVHQNPVLQEWQDLANQELSDHLSQYVDGVIRRPLGKWLDFLESTEALMKTADSMGSISKRPSHSRSSLKKLLALYNTKEINRSVDLLKKRIEKHFNETDEPTTANRAVVSRVLDLCAARYGSARDRMIVIIDRIYENSVEVEWRKEEVMPLFRK